MGFDHSNSLFIRLSRTVEAFREELGIRTERPLLVSERHEGVRRLYLASLLDYVYLASPDPERALADALAALGESARRQLEAKLGTALEASPPPRPRRRRGRPKSAAPEDLDHKKEY